MPRAALRHSRRRVITLGVSSAVATASLSRVASAQQINLSGPLQSSPDGARAPVMVALQPWLVEGADIPCLKRAETRAQMIDCVKPDPVGVRAKPPARSASDWEVDDETIRAAPHQSGADVLNMVPGLFVTDQGVPGRAPRLSLRGFDGPSGQDAEIIVGNIPLNQAACRFER